MTGQKQQAHLDYMQTLGEQARQAAPLLSILSTEAKNQWLQTSAQLILQHQDQILAANQQDIQKAQNNNKPDAFIDRLTLNEQGINALATQLQAITLLPDPIGQINSITNQPSGIQVGKMRVPIGVIAMIYESRPNVTVEAAALAIKSGNAIVLRGGSDAFQTNKTLADLLTKACEQCTLPKGSVQLIENLDHDLVKVLLQSTDYIDVVIPRGGKGLVTLVQDHAEVPVIKHLDGICHTYIDKDADHEKAVNIAFNAKTQRYGTCNTMETLLVHPDQAQSILTDLLPLYHEKGVELRLCDQSLAVAAPLDIPVTKATEEDWQTEYCAPILSIKIADTQEAMAHIAKYGSGHTECIVTENYTLAQQFLRAVDASSVMINASSRFADGFEYGLGAEIGISTNKLHVRGPVGLEGLTTEKYIVYGDGHIRK